MRLMILLGPCISTSLTQSIWNSQMTVVPILAYFYNWCHTGMPAPLPHFTVEDKFMALDVSLGPEANINQQLHFAFLSFVIWELGFFLIFLPVFDYITLYFSYHYYVFRPENMYQKPKWLCHVKWKSLRFYSSCNDFCHSLSSQAIAVKVLKA